MTLPSPSELRALAEATEREGLHHDLTFVADMARRVADLEQWAAKARGELDRLRDVLGEEDARGVTALLARLDEIRGQA